MVATLVQFGLPGANPFALEGPVTAGTGQLGPQQKPGNVASAEGDCGSEFVYCKLVLGSTTTLADGQLYVVDKAYTMTLLTTTNSPRGNNVVVCRVNQANVIAGTYYVWAQRAGNCPVVATGVGNALAETTATGGTANFTNTPTTTTKYIVGLYLYATNQTFTATTTTGSNVLTLPSSLDDVSLGAAIAGTGIPGSTTISKIDRVANTVTLSANATANGSTITMTLTGVLTANVAWPYIDKTN